MFEELVTTFGGRELQAKTDLKPTETGVTISSAHQLRVYAIPDGLTANRFMHEATMQSALSTRELAVGNIFEPPKHPWWKVWQSR